MKLIPQTFDERVVMLLAVVPIAATVLALAGQPWPALYLFAAAFLLVICWVRRDPPWRLMWRMVKVVLRRERQGAMGFSGVPQAQKE